jgi:hypothetical protein
MVDTGSVEVVTWLISASPPSSGLSEVLSLLLVLSLSLVLSQGLRHSQGLLSSSSWLLSGNPVPKSSSSSAMLGWGATTSDFLLLGTDKNSALLHVVDFER